MTSSNEEIFTIPTRRFTTHYGRDELGFLDPARGDSLLNVEMLLEHPAVLIKAQAWMGKSTLAARLHEWLSTNAQKKTHFGSYVKLTRFEEGFSETQFLPPWWNEWKDLSPGRAACWIIDGLDECEPDHLGTIKRIVREIKEIPAQSHRSQLRLICFSRHRDWLKDEFEGNLRPLYAELSTDGPRVLQLAPLDREEAIRMLGSRAIFDKVARIIDRHEGLANIAGYPRVLIFLGKWNETVPLSVARVWEEVLKDLLQEHNLVKTKRYRTELEHRFTAVARIAAVSTLSGRHELCLLGSEFTYPGLVLEDVFPQAFCADPSKDREAARESIRIGGAFRTSIEGSHRFGHKNIRDWFCAFGLRHLQLEKLRSAVTDEQEPLAHFVDMLRLLKQVSEVANVKTWLTSVLSDLEGGFEDEAWGLEEALRQLDKLERIASESPSNLYIYDNEQFQRLEAPGLGKQIAERLVDSRRHSTVRKLLMDIATALKANEAVAPTLGIVLDETQDINLRERAAILVRDLGTAEDAARLDGPIAKVLGKNAEERSLQAQVILVLLVHRIWSVSEAARYAPPENPVLGDSTFLLIYEMEKRVTAEDARKILLNVLDNKPRREKIAAQRSSKSSFRRKQLRTACIHRLIEQPNLSISDQKMLAYLSVQPFSNPDNYDLYRQIIPHLVRYSYGRRRLYSYFILKLEKNKPNPPHYLRRVLTCEDMHWLLRRAEKKWGSLRTAWEDLYLLTKQTTKPDGHDQSLVERALGAIACYAPTVPEEFEKLQREREEQELQFEEERKRRLGHVERHTIAEVVDKVIHRQDWSELDRARQLSLFCFSGDVKQYQNVDGKWDDLDATQQREVLETCRKGLEGGKPSPLPDENSFTTLNYAESQAFMMVLKTWPSGEWLDAQMIEKWLPTVLQAKPPNSLDAVIACAGRDRQATTAVVVEMINAELKRSESHMFFAHYVPIDLWPGEVSENISRFVKDETQTADTRIRLLELLAAYDSPSALPIAVQWTAKNHGEDGVSPLYRKALDVLLALDPVVAWPLIEADYDEQGVDALRDLSALWQKRGNFGANLPQWTTPQLLSLALILLKAFPLPAESESPSHGIRRMDVDDEIKEARDRAINELLNRQIGGDTHTLDLLFEREPRLKERLDWHIQQSRASQLLDKLGEKSVSDHRLFATDALPVQTVVRLLDEADYRLIRNADDLLNAIVYVLKQIEEDAAYDLSMLYGKNEAKKPGKRINGNTRTQRSRTRLDEDALQAYVRRRLQDMLPSRIPGIEISIIREHQGKYRRRFDLEIIAPTLDRRTVKVIIEIKWSDNRDTGSGLRDQLVRKYLLGHKLSHGIYLVGLTGIRKPATTIQRLKIKFEEQVKSVNASEEGKSLKVVPIILDLSWSDDLPEKASNLSVNKL